MNILKDILGFLNTLTFIDYVFFFSVVILIILIVSLIYFIKINDEVFEEPKVEEPKKDILENIQVEVPTPDIYDENEEGELLDLQALTKQLEANKTLNIDLTQYEKEQEERAIISYDELLKKTGSAQINYENEELVDDITVKKVDLANLVSNIEDNEPKIKVQVISYDREEAFLQALKQLQQNLN